MPINRPTTRSPGRPQQQQSRRGSSRLDDFRSRLSSRRSFDDTMAVKSRSKSRFDRPVKSGIEVWFPKDGENYIRILPPTWEENPDNDFGYQCYMHKFIGPDGGTYMCLDKTLGERCPICVAAKVAERENDEEGTMALKAKETYAVWILDRKDDKKLNTPQLYYMSWKQYQELCDQAADHRSKKVIKIEDIDEGYDITVIKRGKGKEGTTYTFKVDRESSPILDDDEETADVLEFIENNPIPDVLECKEADYLDRVLEGSVAESDPDLDDANGDTSQDYDHEQEEAQQARSSTRRARPTRDEPEPERARRSARGSDNGTRRGKYADEEGDGSVDPHEDAVGDEGEVWADEPEPEPEPEPERARRPARRATPEPDDEPEERPVRVRPGSVRGVPPREEARAARAPVRQSSDRRPPRR